MSSSGSALTGSTTNSTAPSPIGNQSRSRFSKLFTTPRNESEGELSASFSPKHGLAALGPGGTPAESWTSQRSLEGGLSGLAIGTDNEDEDSTIKLLSSDQLNTNEFSFLDDPDGDAFFLRHRPPTQAAPSSVSPQLGQSASDSFFPSGTDLLATSPHNTWSSASFGALGSPKLDRTAALVGRRRERERSETTDPLQHEWTGNGWPANGSSSTSSSPISTRSLAKPEHGQGSSLTSPPLLSTPAFASSAFSPLPNSTAYPSPLLPRLTATVEPFVPKPLPSQSNAHTASPFAQAPGHALSSSPTDHFLDQRESAYARASTGMVRPGQGQSQQQQSHLAQQSRTAYPTAPAARPRPAAAVATAPASVPPPPPAEPSVRQWPIVKVENIPFVSLTRTESCSVMSSGCFRGVD